MAEVLEPHLGKIRIPSAIDKVFKDEAAFSFDTPDGEDGLFICMHSFLGFGRKYAEKYFQKTSHAVFLHIKRIRRQMTNDEETEKAKPTRLAIGLKGGFDVGDKKYETEEFFSVVVLPSWTEFPLSFPGLPFQVVSSVNAIIAADSAARQAELMTWDGEKREVSKYAEGLPQLDNGKKIGPWGWQCERCDLKGNLWLNLTDGAINCGRKFWDGTGGNNHAMEHYQATNYPLAVKLGTITPENADVYSYAEDDMVSDPLLPLHLAHFGIDLMKMEKTDKTMTEMELDLNQRVWEWNVMQESGSNLQPIYGPGYTGIYNLGNSCYMNSVMQVIFTMPSFVDRYFKPSTQIFDECKTDPTNDFNVQMAKFSHGLLSGDYSKPATDDSQTMSNGIRPQMFRSVIGRGHPEFSTNRQQDAVEYLLHLITNVERNCRGSSCPTDSIKFKMEERIECTTSHAVKYVSRNEYVMSLPVPLNDAVNNIEVARYEQKKALLEAEGKQVDSSEVVRPRIQLGSCLDAFATPVFVEDFYSSAVKARVTAKKSSLLSTFPDYLFIMMQKFTVGEDWVERKLDVSIDVPDLLDMSRLRGKGKQDGEQELPEETTSRSQKPAALNINEALVMQLADMGFAIEGCKKAVFHTNNSGIEAAMNWVMEHMGDPDFGDPLVVVGGGGGSDESELMADDADVTMIMSMGFTKSQATLALKSTDNNLERAADWIFSHSHELDSLEAAAAAATSSSHPPPPPSTDATGTYLDGHGKYSLVAFVSHMGTSTKCGHYICHILKEGHWVIYNDEKVALSENPPRDLAYLYVYKRL